MIVKLMFDDDVEIFKISIPKEENLNNYFLDLQGSH